MSDNIEKKSAQPAEPSAEKEHAKGIYKYVPDWVINNAPQITNAGLFIGTGIMLHSGYRGKVISQDIYDKQMSIIKNAEGMTAERAANIVDHATKSQLIKAPGWHKMRLFYLLTAMTSFGIGALFKRKEEAPEELEANRHMGLAEYMRTRVAQGLDPVNHSRQTVGLVSGASGVLAVISALSQPGGVHKSELFVGSTLATGGALLAFINDPKTAQNAFSALWMSRLPAIVTGTKESMWTKPGFKNPLVHEMKQTEAFRKGLEHAYVNGKDEKVLLGLRTVKRQGAQAVAVYDKTYGSESLPYDRKDIAYPIGQWTNFFAASVGFLGKGASKAKEDDAKASGSNADATVVDIKNPLNMVPQPKVQKVDNIERLQAVNDVQYARTANSRP